MSKKTRKTTQPAQPHIGATVAAPATVTEQGKAKPQVIKVVKADVKYRGARAEWYAVLCKHDGKPAGDFLAATTATPPSVPKSGVVEKASGWLRYFTRTGVAELV